MSPGLLGGSANTPKVPSSPSQHQGKALCFTFVSASLRSGSFKSFFLPLVQTVQLWVIETTFLYVSKSVQPWERNHNINWIIYPKWMPPANSFVRPFSYIGLSECLLLSSYMWVSLMHTLVWLVPNILSNSGAYRRPSQTTELQGAITSAAASVINGVGLGNWLPFSDLMFQKRGVLHFHWPLSKAEEGQHSCFHTKGHRFGLLLCVSEYIGLEKKLYFRTSLPPFEMHPH